MIKIIGERGSGKTTKLIELSAEKQIPILCPTAYQQRNILIKAKELGYDIPVPVLLTSELKTQDIRKGEDVLVDDAEWILTRVLEDLKFNMKGFAISINDLGEELYEI